MRIFKVILIGLLFASISSKVFAQNCTSSNTTLCLNQERFRVEVTWRDFDGNTGSGTVAPASSDDSGIFWFFDQDNWEMLIKVLDGCSITNHFWVYAAATTNVEYTLTVTDTLAGRSKSYSNQLGVSSPAITDTAALATCATNGNLPPDPGPANDTTLEGIDSDGDGIRDDVQRFIALELADPGTQAASRQLARSAQKALVDSNSKPMSLDNAGEFTRGIECLFSVRPGDGDGIAYRLIAEILDTDQRGRAYLRYSDHLEGEFFPLRKPAEWASSCTSSTAPISPAFKIQKDDSTCLAGEGTKIYYGNGVNTLHFEATVSLGVLISRLENYLTGEELDNISFELAFNPTGGFWEDLWEAFDQEINTNFSQFYHWVSGLELMPDVIRDIFVDLASHVDESALVSSSVLQGQVTSYKGAILEGKKAIVVAHSQGNFFANQAYPNMTSQEQRSFGVVSVANPDDFVAGGGRYTTINQDLVILAVDILVGALDSNVNNGLSVYLRDVTGHGFNLAYMEPESNSLAKILGDIRATNNSLEQPGQVAEEGIITVTLTWGAQPDVDLHAFEPNGTHVYYANPVGQSGFLDVDDVTSFGPEHYFVGCDSLEIGTYRIGVNYYQGSGPETANIRIDAGLLARTFQVTLPQAQGPFGDSAPVSVANIEVSGNQNDGYVFRIE